MASDPRARPRGARRRAPCGGGETMQSSPSERRPTSARRNAMAPVFAISASASLVHATCAFVFPSTKRLARPPAATAPNAPTTAATAISSSPARFGVALLATRAPARLGFGMSDEEHEKAKAREWQVRAVRSADGSEKVTVVDKGNTSVPDGENEQGGRDGEREIIGRGEDGTGDGGEEWKVWSSFVGSEMEEAEAELAVFGDADAQLPLDEEDVEEIAAMLVEEPPTLRQLRADAVGSAADKSVIDLGGKDQGDIQPVSPDFERWVETLSLGTDPALEHMEVEWSAGSEEEWRTYSPRLVVQREVKEGDPDFEAHLQPLSFGTDATLEQMDQVDTKLEVEEGENIGDASGEGEDASTDGGEQELSLRIDATLDRMEQVLSTLEPEEEENSDDDASSEGEKEQGILSLSEKRAQIKAKAATLDEQEDVLMEAAEELEVTDAVAGAVVAEESTPSPTHSIKEGYGQIEMKEQEEVEVTEADAVNALSPEDDDAETLPSKPVEGMKQYESIEMTAEEAQQAREARLAAAPGAVEGSSQKDASPGTDVKEGQTGEEAAAARAQRMKEADEKAKALLSEKKDSATAPIVSEPVKDLDAGEGEDVAEISSSTEPKIPTNLAQSTDAAADQSEQGDSLVTSEDKVEDNPPVVEALGSMFEAAKSFLPSPPEAPPTQHNIDNNHDATNENLSEINEGLQKKLQDRKQDLGRLRRKVNELERELLRAKKTKDKETKKDLEERTASMREKYDRQLDRAKETIAALETEEKSLNEELAEGNVRLEEALEAKERVAAEYSFAINKFARLKGSVDAETAGLSSKLDESQQEVLSLETQLANATEEVEKYQLESKNWRDECTNKANQLDVFTSRVKDMQGTIDNLQSGIHDTQENIDKIISTAKAEEKARSKGNLQRLSDEYEAMIRAKSKKIGELRTALRGANAKRRHVERFAEKERKVAVKEVRDELTAELDVLRGTLNDREDEIAQMEGAVAEAKGAKEEREKLLAEITFLEKSFEELQADLSTNAQAYEDCIQSFEKEAREKDARITELEKELEVANEKIGQLGSQIEKLTAEVEMERTRNAKLTATMSDLQRELEIAGKNSGGYDDVVAILRKEAEEYQAQLSQAKGETESLKRKKAELEELMSKTKDSLVDEKNRVAAALEEKDNRIAQLDRELADQLHEIHSSKSALEETKAELKVMTGKRNSEKSRADALDAKIAKLNQLSGSSTNAASSEEVDRLTKLLDEVSQSNDEYKSLSTTYEDKAKFLSQQLLLSGQNLTDKQRQIFHLKKELSDTTAQADAKAEAKSSASDEVSALKAKLEEVQSHSTVWKAQANGMIVQLTNDLKEKEASASKLQDELDKKSKEEPTSSGGESGALEQEIAALKTAMEEAQLKAKEKMWHKNQSLKEMEDTVASLTAQVNDLKREKDQMSDRLNNEVRRSEDDFTSHEQQLRQTKERLAKEHLADMTQLESELNQSIQQLESEIQTLKKSRSSRADAPTSDAQNQKLRQMEDALRRSQGKEVSLINENMKMQQRIEGLQRQTELRSRVATMIRGDEIYDDDDDDEDDAEEGAVELPAYFKERQRPVVIRAVGKVWRKLFRRKRV